MGRNGLLGDPTQGRAGDQVYVNAATGNLVIQRRDEVLVGVGPGSAIARTYNSQGALTGNLAIEFAPDKIRVNAVAPAVVETPLFDPILSPEQLQSFNKFHPLGRNGRPRDITEAVLFLADEEKSGWITGVVLPVDGGVTAGRN